MKFKSVLAATALALSIVVHSAQAEQVSVFAAASTSDALTEIGAAFAAAGPHEIRASFASSSTLAKQIEQGAPAQVFISANEKWADYLDAKGLLAAGTRTNLLGNALVLIAPVDSKQNVPPVVKGFDLAGALAGGRLSVGDPDHVPAGIYAKQALTSLGIWEALESKLARTNDVRSALALVERGEAPFGIVYATDAAISKGVKVVGAFPADSHPPAVYPAAVAAAGDTPAARAFMAFLKTKPAAEIFAKYGFKTFP